MGEVAGVEGVIGREMIEAFVFDRPSLPPVARRSTGESSCRSMTTGQSFRRRIDELPVIDIHSL